MPKTEREWHHCDDLTWYSLYNLSPIAHISVVQMLNIALVNAHKLKILPVASPENIHNLNAFSATGVTYSTVRLTKLDEPSVSETQLAESTLRTVLQLEAVPPELYDCVRRALAAALDAVISYSLMAPDCPDEDNGRWHRGTAACRRYGLVYSFTTISKALRSFNREARLYYSTHNPLRTDEDDEADDEATD